MLWALPTRWPAMGALVLALTAGAGARALEPVDLELVLLADGSRSIDEAEIRFQRESYAAAIMHDDVLSAIRSAYHGRIALTYVEWGDARSQEIIVPWQVVDGPESAAAFARALLAHEGRAQGTNAIGTALALAHRLIAENQYAGERRVIDFSGDSANNLDGVPIEPVRERALADGITINGLAVYCFACSGPPVAYDVAAAFAERIIGGKGSFVISADHELSFLEAVRRKLVLEIAGYDLRIRRVSANAGHNTFAPANN